MASNSAYEAIINPQAQQQSQMIQQQAQMMQYQSQQSQMMMSLMLMMMNSTNRSNSSSEASSMLQQQIETQLSNNTGMRADFSTLPATSEQSGQKNGSTADK